MGGELYLPVGRGRLRQLRAGAAESVAPARVGLFRGAGGGDWQIEAEVGAAGDADVLA